MLLNDVRFLVVNLSKGVFQCTVDLQALQACGVSGASEARPKQLSQAETCPTLLDRAVSGEDRGDGRRDGPHHRVVMESAHLFRSDRLSRLLISGCSCTVSQLQNLSAPNLQ